MSVIHEIIHHGWLVKSPKESKDRFIWNIFKKKKWKRRYFLLTMATHVRPSRSALTSSTPSLASTKTSIFSTTGSTTTTGTTSGTTSSTGTGTNTRTSSIQTILELSYYESARMARKVGSIDLERCEEVLTHLRSDPFQNVFAVKTFQRDGSRRTYFLVADTELEMVTWVTQLSRYLKMVNEGPLSRHSNRSSSGTNNQVQTLQNFPLSHVPSLSTTALDCRGLNRTPTLARKPTSVDYTDAYSLSSLPRNATLGRLNSFSRNAPYSPHPSHPSYPLPQCPPPADYHEFLPLLTPTSSFKSRLRAEQRATSEDKNIEYFTEGVTQLLRLQNQSGVDDESPDAKGFYDSPKKRCFFNPATTDEERHFYHNRVSQFYDVPGSLYSREKVESYGRFAGFVESHGDSNSAEPPDGRVVYSVPGKMTAVSRGDGDL